MTYEIEQSKLEQVADLVRSERPEITPESIRDTCVYDWSEGREHQDWLDSASPRTIADWVLSVNCS